jgi:hypothetical protein
VVYIHSTMETWLQLNSVELVEGFLKAARGFRRGETETDKSGQKGTDASCIGR